MPGANLTLTVSSILDGTGFKDLAAQVREAGVGLDKVQEKGGSVNKIFSELQGVIGTLTLVEFLKKAAEESAQNEQSQMRLKTAVENSGRAWEKNKDNVNGYLQSLSAVSRFSGTELEQAFTILLNRTHDVTVSQKLLKTAMGINVSTGEDLASVAGNLGSAANGNAFALRGLSREYGLTADQAKNADKALEALSNRFDKTAVSEESAMKSALALKNSFMDVLGAVGDLVNAVLVPIEEVITNVLEKLSHSTKALSNLLKAGWDAIRGNAAAAKEDMAKFNEEMEKAMGLVGKGLPKAAEDGGRRTTDAAHRMSDELKNIVDSLNKETLQLSALTTEQKISALAKETDNEKRIIKARADYQILTEKGKQQVLAAIDANAAAKKLQLEKETAKKIVDNTNQYLSIIGTAVGASLTGQKDAWKIALGGIIDALQAQISAQIGMITAAKVADDLLSDDYASAAKHVAIGALQIGAVAALASGAKGLLNPGASDSSINNAATGGGSSAASTTAAPAAPAQPRQQQQSHISVVVQGSVVGDVNELARRISDAVQNRNVRLVATQVKGGA